MGIGVSGQSDVSQESRSNVRGKSHVLSQMRFIPAWGMLQQVVLVVLTAVQMLAVVPWVDAWVSSKLPRALWDVFRCCSLNYSSMRSRLTLTLMEGCSVGRAESTIQLQ